jgi:ubiquinone/menaquinone biosynthesis C-methylase UbiE
MGVYDKYILPKVVNFTCGLKPTMRQREKVVPMASGEVLEIGIGSGLNLPYYQAGNISKVWGLDPSPEMRAMARKNARGVEFDLELIGLPGDEIPLDDNSVDTLLITYTLCTISETQPALKQMARVLKPDGKFIFCEHGAAPDPGVLGWQNRLNPVWKRLGGGCNLNRDIPGIIERGGFQIVEMSNDYIPGFRPASFNYWGTAQLAD